MQKEVNAIHKTINVTEWMKKTIEDFLIAKRFTIVLFSIDSEIMTRMGKMSILNNLSLKIVNEEGKNYSLEGYSSSNIEYDNIELKWLIDFIKEREVEAILKFGGKVLGTEEDQKNKNIKVELELVGKKTEENKKFSVFVASNVKEFMSFFLERNFQMAWMGPTTKVEGVEFKFENVVLKDIKKINENSIELKYKWNEWTDFSTVSLEFLQVGDSVKVTVNLNKVPVELTDNVINHWKERILYNISILFRCPLRPVSS